MVSLKKLSMKNKRVFIRCDFNVPLHNGKITSDLRIRQSLKTIQYVLKQKPKQIILASHMGRPDGVDLSLSLSIVAKRLQTLLGEKIFLQEDILAPITSDSKIVLLENLRFFDGETRDCKRLAKKLRVHADVYVNDAFGTAHRKNTSVHALPLLFSPSQKAAGFLIEKELSEVSLDHKKPLVLLFGAAKLRDKIPLLKHLLETTDKVILGGGVVFTFLKAMGVEVGKSLLEEDMIPQAKRMLKKYSKKIVFPVDFLVANSISLNKSLVERKKLVRVVDVDSIPKNKAAYDVGPQSIKLFSAVLKDVKTLIWNGPLGLFEYSPFDTSTKEIAKVVALQKGLHSIICGGDTAAALKKTRYKSDMNFISTGGGASLQLLSGKKLPALEALKK